MQLDPRAGDLKRSATVVSASTAVRFRKGSLRPVGVTMTYGVQWTDGGWDYDFAAVPDRLRSTGLLAENLSRSFRGPLG